MEIKKQFALASFFLRSYSIAASSIFWYLFIYWSLWSKKMLEAAQTSAEQKSHDKCQACFQFPSEILILLEKIFIGKFYSYQKSMGLPWGHQDDQLKN